MNALAIATLIFAVCADTAAAQGPDAASLDGGTLVLDLDEPIETGRLRVALHASAETFPSGRPAFGAAFAPGEETVLHGVPAGDYGLLIHHDVDGDGEIGRNFLGISTEPLGFANRYAPKGAPSFDRTILTVREGEVTLERVALRRLLGESGSIGVGAGAVVQGLPYRGASGAQINPIPIVTYISEDLAILGPQVQYAVGRWDRTLVSATLRARFPAYDEDAADILDGLGDRDLAPLFGVQLDVDGPSGTTLQLTYEHDLIDVIGGGEATLSLRRTWELGDVSLTPAIGARWTARDLVAHDFGVPTSRAIAGRPAYSPSDAVYLEAGFASRTQLTESLQLVLNAGVQVFDSEVTDSPLVEDDTRVSGVLGLVFTL